MNIETENIIIGKIYDAAMEVKLWPEVIQMIVEYTHSQAAIFTALDHLNPNADFIHSFNLPQESLDAYQDEKIKLIDMKLHMPLWHTRAVGDVLNTDLQDYENHQNKDKALFYEKCLKVANVRYIAAVLLDQGQYQWAVLGIHRAPDQPQFNSEELKFLKRIEVHIRRALQIHKQLCLTQLENRNLYRVLDTMKVAVILIDEQQKVCFSNYKARCILQDHQLFEFDQHNRIRTTAKNQVKFEGLLQQTLQTNPHINQAWGGVLSLVGNQGKKFLITMMPFQQHDLLQSQTQMLCSKKYVVLFITEKQAKHLLAKEYLKQHYALSPRECELCELFVNGLSLEQISEVCDLTISSTRTYVKNIYAKLNCNSQIELLHKLLSMTINFEHIA